MVSEGSMALQHTISVFNNQLSKMREDGKTIDGKRIAILSHDIDYYLDKLMYDQVEKLGRNMWL